MIRSRSSRYGRRDMIEPQRFNADANGGWNYAGQHTFGSRLRAERARKGCTRHLLALRTGIHEKRLVAIEMGKEMPSFKEIRTIAAVLDIPETDLMTAGHIKH